MAVLPLVSLCTGGAGLDIGLARALRPHRILPVLYVEREVFAASYLVESFQKAWLDPAPFWSDLTRLPDDLNSPPAPRNAAQRLE